MQMTKRILVLNSTLPRTELPLIAAMVEMGKEVLASTEEAGSDSDPIEAFGEGLMENVSGGSYTGSRAEGRLSCRAFANLVRVKRDDLQRLKEAIANAEPDVPESNATREA